jgi:maleylacetoacetate isomerase
MSSSTQTPKSTYHLYTFYASSCAARLRIAFNLKNLDYVPHYVDMNTDDHESEAYRAINPSASIPTLRIETEGEAPFTIAQSVAILEFLEETFPSRTPLLPPPSDTKARARVRELMYIVTSDIFPPTNSRIAQSVKAVRGEREDALTFVRTIMNRGFATYETYLSTYFPNGKYSAGDAITLADVCLIPQVEQARFYKIDFAQFPLLSGVIERLEKVEAFRKAGWRMQGDTPEKDRLEW